MFTHVLVGSNDIARSRRFYEAALGTLGMRNLSNIDQRIYFKKDNLGFGIASPLDGDPASFGNGVTIGFAASDTEQVKAFHAAGIANGGSDAGSPGPRKAGALRSYAAYLRDPDGNKICAISVIDPSAVGHSQIQVG